MPADVRTLILVTAVALLVCGCGDRVSNLETDPTFSAESIHAGGIGVIGVTTQASDLSSRGWSAKLYSQSEVVGHVTTTARLLLASLEAEPTAAE